MKNTLCIFFIFLFSGFSLKSQDSPITQHGTLKNISQNILLAGCVNEDFESSLPSIITISTQVVGWTVTSGTNFSTGYSCSLLGCCPGQPNAVNILQNGYVDPSIGAVYPIYSVFGPGPVNTGTTIGLNTPINSMYGDNFIKLNDNVPNFGVHKLSKTISVTNSNSLFRFAFITVLNTGHTCCDGSSFQLILKNATAGTVIPIPTFSTSGLSTLCTNTLPITFYDAGTTNVATTASSLIYSPWQLGFIDLSSLVGINVTIEVIATDCTAGSHFGCVYFDAQCEPMGVYCPATYYPFGNIPTCGPTTATVSAPGVGGIYSWTGPAGFTPTTSPTMVTTISGNYTLSINSIGYLSPVTHTFNILITPTASVLATSSNSILCLGNTATITANGLTAYNWNTGAITNSIVVSPTVNTTYTVSGTDVNGCPANNTITQIVSTCTGLEFLNKAEGFQLYPNPNNGEFILRLENETINSELIIENALGQIVFNQSVLKGENAVVLKEIARGIYYFRIQDNKLTVSRGKMVVN